MSKPPFEWSELFSVGNDILDNQHKKILGICAEIDNLAISGAKDFESALFNITEYAKVHFETEERLLEEIGYPHLEDHEAGHKSFYSKIASFHFKNSNGELDPQELRTFLNDWWIAHILQSDMKYKSHFTET